MNYKKNSKGKFLNELVELRSRLTQLQKISSANRQTREALRLSEEKYKDIFEKAPVSIIVTDSAGRIIEINPYHINHIGRGRTTKADYIGKNLITHPNIIKAGISRVYARLLGGQPCELKDVYFPLTTGGVDAYFNIRGVPILEKGKVVGTITMYEDITERKRAEEELKQNYQLKSTINKLLQVSLKRLPLEQLLQSVLKVILSVPRVPLSHKGAIFLLADDSKNLILKASMGLSPSVMKACRKIPLGRCLCGRTAVNKEIICADSKDPRHEKSYKGMNHHGHYVVPICSEGDVLGVIMLYTRLGHKGNREEEEFLRAVANTLAGIIERKKSEKELQIVNAQLRASNKKLRSLALRDPHTGLYNYRYLGDVIEAEFDRARREAHPLSVFMLDIDYFKSINDVYGHNFGDLVLCQLAKILRKMVRRYDVVVRFGGEEFIIISPGIDRAASLELAKRLLGAINLYNFGDEKTTVKLKLSIAVASFPEDKISNGAGLIEFADRILNKVKEFGGNRVYSSSDIKKKRSPHLERNQETGEVKTLREKINKLTKRANQSLIEAVFAFARTIELKDHYTGEHVEKTVRYATELSQALNLPGEDIERVRQAAMLHDLGKIGISEKILLKKTKLSAKEFEKIKKHPHIGVDIIRPIHFLHSIIPFVLYHHERWDGKGYPSGLKQEEIPMGARIIAIADAYQALTSDRPYRKRYPKGKAVELIKKGAGSHFDPQIVNALLRILGKEK